nr:MAG TPA: hypothetical protein [Caudoviricetes sp.]
MATWVATNTRERSERSGVIVWLLERNNNP